MKIHETPRGYFKKEPKTLYNLQEGDIVVSENERERVVLGICGRVYFLSHEGDHEAYDNGATTAELVYLGYTTKQDKQTIEIEGERYSIEEIKSKLKSL